MNEKKISYNRSEILSGADAKNPLIGAMGVFEGFADKVRIRTIKTEKDEKTVSEYELTTIMPDKAVKYFFGNDCVNEKHTLKIKASYWGENAAESARKHTPEKSQLIRVFIKNMKVESWKGKDGAVKYMICGTGAQHGLVYHMSKPGKKDPEGREIPSILEDKTQETVSVSKNAPVMDSDEEFWESFDAEDGSSPWNL